MLTHALESEESITNQQQHLLRAFSGFNSWWKQKGKWPMYKGDRDGAALPDSRLLSG